MFTKTRRFFASPRRRFGLLAAVSLVLLAGAAAIVACTTFSSYQKAPIVRLASVGLGNPDHQGATLLFEVEVENPNKAALEVDAVDYAVDLDGKPFAAGAIDKKLRVEALGKTTIEVPVRLRFADVLTSALNFLASGTTKYRIKGTAKISFFHVPFEHTGEVNISDLH